MSNDLNCQDSSIFDSKNDYVSDKQILNSQKTIDNQSKS